MKNALAFLVLLAFVPMARSQPTAPAQPTTVEDLEATLRTLGEQAQRLALLSGQDKYLWKVKAYEAYSSPADFADDRRAIKATDLLKWLGDSSRSDHLRSEVVKALSSEAALKHDPDLLEKRGNREPRKYTAQRWVVPGIQDRERTMRVLAQKLLLAWFPQGKYQNEPDIMAYDPVKGDRRNWHKAYLAWQKALR